MTNPDNAGGLPELPEPWSLVGMDEDFPVFSAAQMRAYGELCRAAPAGMVLVPREIVANYRESTHIPRHRRICDSALAAPAGGDDCKTCQGHGMIGWTTGQTPEQFDQHEAPCPDCSAPAGSGEVVVPAIERMLVDAYAAGMNGDNFDMLAARRNLSALLRKLQQEP